ncbi:glycosyl transferase [Agromyces sp. Root1464]|uniref:glycosyltransferase n=1 Tax=Agromyces sp. Root1464 TaxID=1736467 RepID=UPI0006F46975|nr:glycosyltransferase [Agromyces sp. Root1464]KQZ08737.1 glycosyl transferase [Agromyces sp. Root1464]
MTSGIVLSKVIFPGPGEPDMAPLYLDADEWTEVRQEVRPEASQIRHRRGPVPNEVHTTPLRVSHVNALGMITGRRSLTVPAGGRVSLGTYFNAFPASYWQRWTDLRGVRLSVTTSGEGDVAVYRSNARGVIQTVASKRMEADTTTVFDLSFDNFLDGGWFWFDLISNRGEFSLVEADWLAPEGSAPVTDGNLTVSITTLNRTDYCLALLETIGSDPDAVAGIDEVLVVDQGTQKIREQTAYPSAQQALGGRLRVIEQANVGGSGGFSRGMYEVLDAGRSDFLMLLDDDVAIEPECVRRALAFARFCTNPTIVGGHMFDMYDKTKLHAYAESVDRWTFMWGPVTPDRHDFTSSNLRQTGWLHRRFDVDYNGWWMSLIPVKIIREIGLSLPVFIKWDDAEYSLRAAEHGYRTVSLPGAAIWHVSWVDKDDTRDWQAFFHARNRLVAALLHSPHRKGGRLPMSNLANDIRHVLTLDYYAVTLRQLAYESVLAGPDHLHGELQTRLPAIRAKAPEFRESTLTKDISQFGYFPPTAFFGDDPGADGTKPTGFGAYRFVAKYGWRHWFRNVPASSKAHPEAHLPHGTPWWKLPSLDSFAVSNAEGSGVTWHVRDRSQFRALLVSSIRLNLSIRRRWKRLSNEYRQSVERITAPATWGDTLGLEGRSPSGTPEQ